MHNWAQSYGLVIERIGVAKFLGCSLEKPPGRDKAVVVFQHRSPPQYPCWCLDGSEALPEWLEAYLSGLLLAWLLTSCSNRGERVSLEPSIVDGRDVAWALCVWHDGSEPVVHSKYEIKWRAILKGVELYLSKHFFHVSGSPT